MGEVTHGNFGIRRVVMQTFVNKRSFVVMSTHLISCMQISDDLKLLSLPNILRMSLGIESCKMVFKQS